MPHHLIAATMAHTWSRQWTGAVTGLTSIVFFWFAMTNITLLVIFLSVTAKRRTLREQDRRHAATTRALRQTRPPAEGGTHDGSRAAHGATAPGAADPSAAANRLGRMLLSDAERDHAASLVSRAIAEGRLGFDEGAARVDKVLGARRRVTLEPILADLPDEVRPSGESTTPAGVLALRVAAATLVAAAAVLQAVAGVWALWPVAVAALAPLAFSPARGGARAHARPAPGDSTVER